MQDLKELLEVTMTNRRLMSKVIESLTLQQMNVVPQGFNNSIFWNLAHTVVTQQLLCYKLSGNTMMVSDEMVEKYKKGTKTEVDGTQEELDIVKSLFFATIDTTVEDLSTSIFDNFVSYTTSTGFTIKNISDAISFNNFHEGIHFGYILAQRKLVL